MPTKYKSFKEVFLIHLHSTVSRIRQGILCSPIIGREGGDEKLSIIAVGLNGSVSILKGTRPRTVSILQWIQNFWLELSGIRGLSVLPGTHYTLRCLYQAHKVKSTHGKQIKML